VAILRIKRKSIGESLRDNQGERNSLCSVLTVKYLKRGGLTTTAKGVNGKGKGGHYCRVNETRRKCDRETKWAKGPGQEGWGTWGTEPAQDRGANSILSKQEKRKGGREGGLRWSVCEKNGLGHGAIREG